MRLLLLIISFLFLNLNAFSQCSEKVIQDYLIYLDVTDHDQLEALTKYLPIEFKRLLHYFEKEDGFSSCHGISCEVYPLNDLGNNRGYKIGFHAIESKMTDVQINRQVKPQFANNLRESIKKVVALAEPPYQYTRIYEPLCQEIAKRSADKRPLRIFIFSDMLEHNSTSFYRSGNQIDIDKTLAKLSKDSFCKLSDDMSFVEIQFISFRDSENDRNISSATHFWIELFKSRKAKVSFGSSVQLE